MSLASAPLLSRRHMRAIFSKHNFGCLGSLLFADSKRSLLSNKTAV